MRNTTRFKSWATAVYLATSIAGAEHAHAQGDRKVRPDSLPMYLEFQVTEAARVLEWVTPAYPSVLKTRKVEGAVVIQFVVDTLGQMEHGTLRVLRATNPAFESAVRATLASARFSPAVREGKRVRQLMVQPFAFRVEK